MPTIQSWLAGSSSTDTIDAAVASHIVANAKEKLRDAVKRNFEDPTAHLDWFGTLYKLLIS